MSAKQIKTRQAGSMLWCMSVEARHLIECFDREEKRKEGLRLLANCKKWARRLDVDERRLA